MPNALLKDRFPIVTDQYDPKIINAIIDILEQTLSKTSLPQQQTSYASDATYNMQPADQIIFVSRTATGASTVNLALSTFRRGAPIVVKDSGENAGTNNITIVASGSDSIDGAANYVINKNGGAVTLIPDGNNKWYVVDNSNITEGIPSLTRVTGKTAAATITNAFAVGTADASFLISANVNVTTSITHAFSVTVSYTDETNTSRTLTLMFSQLAGSVVTSITNVTGAGPYEGVATQIRCKASTTITTQTTGTFTTVTYNAETAVWRVG